MVEQEKVGKFISAMRKEKNLTQKQLAEQLGITDKAISKWETGRSMPDNTMLLDLCKILGVSLNDLLSGERLSKDNYGGKAEENMMHLIKENEKQKNTNKWTIFGTLGGIICLCVAILFTIIQSAGFSAILWFVDLPSFLIVLGIPMIVLAASGMVKDFFHGFLICYKTEYNAGKNDILQAYVAMATFMKTSLLTGCVVAVINIVLLIGTIADASAMGICLAVALISITYSLLLNVLLMSTAARLKVICEITEKIEKI